ncbi:MAG: glycosyl hydrolase family 95 catalytic domain-containing protein [Phycisphaerales bacterium]
MSHTLAALAILVAVALGPAPFASAQPPRPPQLAREGGISRWDEGLPLGNGLLGVLVWGEGNVVRLSLDRGDLWDTRIPETLQQPDWTYATMIRLKESKDHATHQRLFDVPYDTVPYPTKLPVGRLELVFPESVNVERFALDAARAEATVTLAGASVRAVVDATRTRVLVFVDGAVAEPRLVPPAGVRQLGYPDAEPSSEVRIDAGSDGHEVFHRSFRYVQPTIGEAAFAVSCREVRDGAASRLAIAIEPGPSRAVAVAAANRVAESVGEGLYPALIADHLGWWAERPGTSSVSLPDQRHQRHYDLCRYLYLAGSRPGAPPIPLQGVWTADEGGLPPWKGDYHNDLNTQMTYLAYPAAGMFEPGRAWLDFNWNLLPAYREFARGFYGIGGAVVPGVMTIDGRPMGGWGQYSLSPTHGAWIAHNFYMHWKHTSDAAFLRDRCYPWCAEIGEALLALLTPDAKGRLKLPLSSSPEIYDNSYKAWMPANSNYDLALLRFLLTINTEMARALGDAAAGNRWADALTRLDPLDIDAATHALTFARGFPYNESHRHFSHAMAIYPLATLTIDGSDSDRRTIVATIDQLHAVGTRAWCGYSFAWMSAMCARAGQPERALDYLDKYLAFTGPNGFHLNGDQTKSGLSDFTYRPFTLEGNFIAMQAVHEMLLQSWGRVGEPGTEIVRIFPAVSERWPDASFTDLRAEGGWRVSAERRGGRTTRVTVTLDPAPGAPAEPRTLRLRDPFEGRAAMWSLPVRREGDEIVVPLEPRASLEGVASGG